MTKALLITISIFLLFGSWQTCKAQQELLIDYPTIPGATKPGAEGIEGRELPEFIKYIYLFALGAVGITALIAMLIGALMYVFSSGKPDKMADAKDRIISAILGIILLLVSVLILQTINPDLIRIGLTLPTIPLIPNGGNGEDVCECGQEVQSATNIPEGTSNKDQWCQQYVQDNCPSRASTCGITDVSQDSYTGTWWCNWKAIWSAQFGPGYCSDCNVSSGVCLRYFNNTLLKPCSSPGTTCSANCL